MFPQHRTTGTNFEKHVKTDKLHIQFPSQKWDSKNKRDRCQPFILNTPGDMAPLNNQRGYKRT